MLVKVSTLGKAEVAPLNWAMVGTLVGVDAEMIEKVVPLPKPFVAAFFITLQHFDIALRRRVLVCENSEFFSVRHMLFDLYRSKIKCTSCLHCYYHVIFHLIESIAYISKHFSTHFLLSVISGRTSAFLAEPSLRTLSPASFNVCSRLCIFFCTKFT